MFRHGPDKWARRGALAALGALIALAAPLGGARAAEASQSADTVQEWNLHASNALMNAPPNTLPPPPIPGAGQPPHVAQPHLAMVQGAVYDAVNSIDGGHQPYLAGLPPASDPASKKAAVATAAHDVLVGLQREDLGVPVLPQVVIDRLDGLYADELEGIPDGDAETNGIAAGAAAADAMLGARADDGRYGDFRFTPGTQAGQWRPWDTVPPGSVNDPNAWVAEVDPFLIESQSQFRSKGPHALKTDAYTREYNEVKALGTAPTTAQPRPRTDKQEAIAQFYNVNPVELFNRTFRQISEDRGLTLVDDARLFAMLNTATADAVISCWNEKAHWSNWRPITAIREGNNDGNPSTVGDPGWTPLIPTPPYPDHTSGYNCATSSFMHTAEVFFGRGKTEFSVDRTPSGVTRDYERFTDVIDDTIDARVYQGIHFRASDVQGAEIGKDVAHWLETHYFQPVK
jgi:hypothetical protein